MFVFINLTFDFILILLHMRIGTSKLNTSLKWVFTTQIMSGLFRDIRVCNYSSKLVSCCRKIKQEIIYTCSCHRYRFIPFRQVYLFLEKGTSQTNNKIPETYLPSYYHNSNVIWLEPGRSALNYWAKRMTRIEPKTIIFKCICWVTMAIIMHSL